MHNGCGVCMRSVSGKLRLLGEMVFDQQVFIYPPQPPIIWLSNSLKSRGGQIGKFGFASGLEHFLQGQLAHNTTMKVVNNNSKTVIVVRFLP